MQSLFIQILNMSITGSIIILFVLAARLILCKAPKIYSYLLWLIPFFRLICPFSIESIYSLIPVNSQPIPQDIAMAQIPEIDTGIAAVNNAVNTSLPAPAPTASVNPMQIWLAIGEGLWLLGIAVMVLYTLISYIILLVRLYESSGHTGGGIYIADNIEIPFVMGIFKPRIYIPSGLSRDEREFIILHERTHIKRHDYIFKLIGWIILTIHWFNPLVHLAYRLMEKDMEMSCDEAVISKANGDIKKAYSSSLLYFSQAKYKNRLPVAFGLCDIKSRVKNILSYKKPPVIIVAVLVMAVGIFGAVCMISPEREIQQTTFPIYDSFVSKQSYTLIYNDVIVSQIDRSFLENWFNELGDLENIKNVNSSKMADYGEYKKTADFSIYAFNALIKILDSQTMCIISNSGKIQFYNIPEDSYRKIEMYYSTRSNVAPYSHYTSPKYNYTGDDYYSAIAYNIENNIKTDENIINAPLITILDIYDNKHEIFIFADVQNTKYIFDETKLKEQGSKHYLRIICLDKLPSNSAAEYCTVYTITDDNINALDKIINRLNLNEQNSKIKNNILSKFYDKNPLNDIAQSWVIRFSLDENGWSDIKLPSKLGTMSHQKSDPEEIYMSAYY